MQNFSLSRCTLGVFALAVLALSAPAAASDFCRPTAEVLGATSEAAAAIASEDFTRQAMALGTASSLLATNLAHRDGLPSTLVPLFEQLQPMMDMSSINNQAIGANIASTNAEIARYAAGTCSEPVFATLAAAPNSGADPVLSKTCSEMRSRVAGFEALEKATAAGDRNGFNLALQSIQGNPVNVEDDMAAAGWPARAIAAQDALFQRAMTGFDPAGSEDMSRTIEDMRPDVETLSDEAASRCP